LQCVLYEFKTFGVGDEMATVSSTGSDGYGSAIDTSINYATVDNSPFSYYLEVMIPAVTVPVNLEFYFITIGFAYPT
jgi:hypothetical protein